MCCFILNNVIKKLQFKKLYISHKNKIISGRLDHRQAIIVYNKRLISELKFLMSIYIIPIKTEKVDAYFNV